MEKLQVSNNHLYYVLHINLLMWTKRDDVYVDIDRGVLGVSGEVYNIEYNETL